MKKTKKSAHRSTHLPTPSPANFPTQKILRGTGLFWLFSVILGQWLFFYFILAFYGYSILSSNLDIWNRFEPLGSTPYVAGDFGGNTAFALHVMGAGIIAFGGALQLMPQVRAWAPGLHRWNGRIYLLTVLGLSLSGFYLVWIRGTSPNLLSSISTTINGFLILAFATLALRYAIQRDINTHLRWALRLYLAANAQWFLRVGVFSYMVTGTVMGFKPSFGDPFFVFWTFACYLFPLAVLQLYFYASGCGNKHIQYLTSVILIALTLLMITGIIGFTPFLQKLISGEPLGF